MICAVVMHELGHFTKKERLLFKEKTNNKIQKFALKYNLQFPNQKSINSVLISQNSNLIFINEIFILSYQILKIN